MIFSSNAETRSWALGSKHSSPAEFIREFKSLKPCIHGSDAHTLEALCKPDHDNFCWIKADPTFRGLRQVLNEPEDRVYCGVRPPLLDQVDKNKTRYMAAVTIKKTTASTLAEHWFDCSIPLNSGLISIIGNKGSGKSALSDTIALLGFSRNVADCSFLNDQKFLHPRSGKGSHFEARLDWMSGKDSGSKLLNAFHPNSSFEYVQYLPQQYLEHICTELNEGGRTKFDEELESVVFSHIPREEQLETVSLDDLLERLKAARGLEKANLQDKVGTINKLLSQIEHRLRPDIQLAVKESLAALERDLRALDAAKPMEVKPTEQDANKAQEQNS